MSVEHELPTDTNKYQILIERQKEIAEIYGISPNRLKGLELCDICDGQGQLPAIRMGKFVLNDLGFSADQSDLNTSNRACTGCGGTGVMFGGLELSARDWINISRGSIYMHGTRKIQHLENFTGNPATNRAEELALLELVRGIKGGQFIRLKPKQRGRIQKRR